VLVLQLGLVVLVVLVVVSGEREDIPVPSSNLACYDANMSSHMASFAYKRRELYNAFRFWHDLNTGGIFSVLVVSFWRLSSWVVCN
jgi:hypothetical protein